MSKYKSKSQFLQKQFDEKNYSIAFNFIISYKGIDSTHKLVYNLMLNDFYMNDNVTWKQQTYADKLGLTRQQISNIFNLFIEKKVLIPNKDNKSGSKNNTYKLSSDVSPLVKKKTGYKKGVVHKPKRIDKPEEPVKPDVQTCKPPFTQRVKPDVQTCKPPFTYNTSNTGKTCNTEESDDSLLKEESSSLPEEKKTPTDLELEIFARNLDL